MKYLRLLFEQHLTIKWFLNFEFKTSESSHQNNINQPGWVDIYYSAPKIKKLNKNLKTRFSLGSLTKNRRNRESALHFPLATTKKKARFTTLSYHSTARRKWPNFNQAITPQPPNRLMMWLINCNFIYKKWPIGLSMSESKLKVTKEESD